MTSTLSINPLEPDLGVPVRSRKAAFSGTRPASLKTNSDDESVLSLGTL